MKRVARETRKLKTLLGRVVRDTMRKVGENVALQEQFTPLWMRAVRLLEQKREHPSRCKLYSVHAPEVECICKGGSSCERWGWRGRDVKSGFGIWLTI